MKASELRVMNESDLNQKLEECKHELLELRFKNAGHNLKNPIKLREARRDIARINTIITEKKRSMENGKTA